MPRILHDRGARFHRKITLVEAPPDRLKHGSVNLVAEVKVFLKSDGTCGRQREERRSGMWFRKKSPTAKLDRITPEEQRLAFAHLERSGWKFDNLYHNFDAWIDYGLGVFVRGKQKIKYEWYLYLDGTFSGAPDIISEIRRVIGREGDSS